MYILLPRGAQLSPGSVGHQLEQEWGAHDTLVKKIIKKTQNTHKFTGDYLLFIFIRPPPLQWHRRPHHATLLYFTKFYY